MTYILDTNIILDSVENLLTLSDNNTNILVIPETVIDETLASIRDLMAAVGIFAVLMFGLGYVWGTYL